MIIKKRVIPSNDLFNRHIRGPGTDGVEHNMDLEDRGLDAT